MKKFKALYKAMLDDLKDAEMMIDYACEIREESLEDKNLADELARYASFRLNHFMEFHNLFQNEARKMPKVTDETVSMCMWKESHEEIQKWYQHIKHEIEKY